MSEAQDVTALIAEAAAALSAAEDAVYKVQRRVNAEVQVAADAVRAKHSAELSEAANGVRAARQTLNSAKEQLPDHPWTGKRVFHLVSRGHVWQKLQPDRVEGIVETRRAGTSFPANAAYYSIPATGEGFVRLLKKDGTPGVKFDRIRGWKLA